MPLYAQVNSIARAIIASAKRGKGMPCQNASPIHASGRCHSAHERPRITLAVKALLLA